MKLESSESQVQVVTMTEQHEVGSDTLRKLEVNEAHA